MLSIRVRILIFLTLGICLILSACADPERQPPTISGLPQASEPTAIGTEAYQTPTLESVTMTMTARPPSTSMPSPRPSLADSGNADVLYVRAVYNPGTSTWTFHVTVSHPDTGWEDYADGWDVLLPDGTVLKPDAGSPFTRLLLHPHEAEQPFTRSQSGIDIPTGTGKVIVRAHDLIAGFGGKEVEVDLTVSEGPDFEVSQ